MKKIYLIGLIGTLIACQEDMSENVESIAEFDKQETIVLDGSEVTLNFKKVNGEIQYEESEALNAVRKLAQGEEMVLMINSEIDAPLFFSNEKMAKQFNENPSAIESLHAKFGSIKEASDNIKGVRAIDEKIQGAAPASGSTSFTISRAHSLRSPVYTVNLSSRWSTRHLLRNQCATGGIDFDNEISSFSVKPGLQVKFYEDPDYKGKLLWVSTLNTTLYVANLQDLKKRYTRIVDGVLVDGSQCGWFCSSWNDKITAVSAYRNGYSEFPRNTSNTCPQ